MHSEARACRRYCAYGEGVSNDLIDVPDCPVVLRQVCLESELAALVDGYQTPFWKGGIALNAAVFGN